MIPLGGRFNKRSLFLTAVLIGAISVALSVLLPISPNFFGVFIPTAVLFGYIYLGFSSEASNAENTQYADSIYYLGFIFTLFALCATLWDFEELNDSVIARFGLALLTTLIGLVVRVSITNFNTSYTEALSIAENSLYLSVLRFDAHVRANLESLESIQQEMSVAAEERVATHNQIISDVSRSSAETLASVEQAVNGAVNKLKRDIDSLELPSDIISSKLSEPLESLVQQLSSLESGTSEFNRKQQALYGQIIESTGDLNESLSSAASSIETSLQTFNDIKAVIEPLNNQMVNLSLETESGAERIAQQTNALAVLIKASDKGAHAISKLTESISNFERRLRELEDTSTNER